MLIISLRTVAIGMAGCAAAEKASKMKAEAAQAETEAAPAEMEASPADAEAAPAEFTGLDDYQKWVKDVGYPQDMLVAMGVDGINQDYFHTLSDAPGYTSGKIVIGDSRCCQLGIYEQGIGAADFADYAVWGGHFLPGAEPPAMTDEQLSEVERCFQEQIKDCGECSIYFLPRSIITIMLEMTMTKAFLLPSVQLKSWSICPAKKRERFTSRKCVIVIGFDGGQGDILQSIPAEFNRYVDDYNEKLRTAVNNSAFLKQNAEYFRTVPEITGGRTGFNEDGLHYSDDTIKEIVEFILEH